MRAPCPLCGSTRHRAISATGTFQVRASRRCRDCGHEWEPPSPRWLLRLGLVVGLAWFATCAFFTFAGPILGDGPVDPGFLPIGLVGLAATAECWRRLRRPQAIGEPPPPDPDPDTAP